MRGADVATGALFSYVDLEARVPAGHPLRVIRGVVNDVLAGLDAEFSKMYAALGRPSIAPEKLLRGSLIQAFHTIRSERQLMEQLDYNLLFRWFVGLGIDDPVWDHSTYSKNRDRLLEADIARKFLTGIVEHPKVKPLLSDEHFTVDGTLVAAWASMKSVVPKQAPPPEGAGGSDAPEQAQPNDDAEPAKTEDTAQMQSNEEGRKSRNAEVDFHGQKRCNATHASTTDPEARLYRKGKGKEAKLSFMGHALAENRHGLIVETGINAGDRHCRARGSQGDDREPFAGLDAPAHARCRQGLRRRRLRGGAAWHVRAPARGAEYERAVVRHRRAHHPAQGLRSQSAQTQADRGGLRLGQDHRRSRPADAQWNGPHGLPVHLHHGRLRSHPPPQAPRHKNCVRRSRMRRRPAHGNSRRPRISSVRKDTVPSEDISTAC
jgi:transposase